MRFLLFIRARAIFGDAHCRQGEKSHLRAMSEKTEDRIAVRAERHDASAGGGPFAFSGLSLGIFLVDQPTHFIAIGSDKRLARPLEKHQGWIMAPGSDGVCEFHADHSFVSVEVDEAVLRDVGFDPSRGFAPHVGVLDPLLLQLALAAAEPPAGAPGLYQDTIRNALAAQIAQVVRPMSPRFAAIDDVRLRRVVSFIEENLAHDVTLDALASEAAMSPFHFSRAFKSATGLSPLQFVISERLLRARLLLQTTSLPIAEIAHRVGYDDPARFSQQFKRRFNCTPRQSRG